MYIISIYLPTKNSWFLIPFALHPFTCIIYVPLPDLDVFILSFQTAIAAFQLTMFTNQLF